MSTVKLVFKRFTDGRRVIGKEKEPSYEIKWQNDSVSWVPKSKLVQVCHSFLSRRRLDS